MKFLFLPSSYHPEKYYIVLYIEAVLVIVVVIMQPEPGQGTVRTSPLEIQSGLAVPDT